MPTPADLTTALLRYVGTPYEFGGKDTGGLDCSGLIWLALADLGVPFVHGSTAQIEACAPLGVDEAWATPGALLWRPGHDAISLGNGTAVEAIRPHVQVTPRTASFDGAPRFTRAGLVPGITYPPKEAPVAVRHVSPAKGRLTSGFGPRSIKPSPHHGIDIAPPTPGQRRHPYHATAAGVVVRVVDLGSTYRHPEAPGNSGWLIKIRHADGSQTWYQHSERDEIFVREGQRVDQGQLLGYMGASGGSKTMGVHLHLEYHPSGSITHRADPLTILGGAAAAVAGPPASFGVSSTSGGTSTSPSTPTTPAQDLLERIANVAVYVFFTLDKAGSRRAVRNTVAGWWMELPADKVDAFRIQREREGFKRGEGWAWHDELGNSTRHVAPGDLGLFGERREWGK